MGSYTFIQLNVFKFNELVDLNLLKCMRKTHQKAFSFKIIDKVFVYSKKLRL